MELKNSKYSHMVHVVVILIMFLTFTLSTVYVTIYCVDVYKKITEKSQENYDLRTGLLYISNKIKSVDNVYINEIKNIDMIIIPETIDGVSYETRIYCYNGKLMEIFTEKDNDVPLSSGMYITDMNSMTIEEEDGLITVIANYENIGDKRIIINTGEKK